MQRIAHARIPLLRRILLAGSAMVVMLCLSEVAVSVLVQPIRYFGGSLAVQIDSQMHYGRQNQTIAMALLMLAPATAALIFVQLAAKRR
jgi:ABC-type Fe3+ transport system permease subunit